jgi:hypothetical protein
MPLSIFCSITSAAGSIGIIPILAVRDGSRKRLRLINRVFPRRNPGSLTELAERVHTTSGGEGTFHLGGLKLPFTALPVTVDISRHLE